MDNRNMKDFLRAERENESKKNAEAASAAGQPGAEDPRRAQEDINRAARRYAGMSEQQMMGEMFRMAQGGRESGELSPQKLEDFYRQAAPMMSAQQRNKLRSIINSLK